MEAPAKLTRSHSSLLRSSPTIRSSIHSLSSVAEADTASSPPSTSTSDHRRRRNPNRAPLGSTTFQGGSTTRLLVPFLAIPSLTLFLFGYFKTCEIKRSEKLLLALTLIAVALFFSGRHKPLFQHSLAFLKQFYFDSSKKLLWFSRTHHHSKPVQWFIGGDPAGTPRGWRDGSNGAPSSSTKFGRQGVEVFSNGDCYEGEFHKDKCNGSGVYNYYLSGRYEGDWVDGRYDGYGIESWAKGSKYRGQYRQGLRHGYGVYRFYTGDTYSGEWCNGQSQGVGLQSCVDGSSYVGEFKGGVKHGLGCYHFRNGDKYAGEYFGDKIHGYGVYHFANGHRYEGSWHEGRKQGYGMYTFRNGTTSSGDWDSGNLKAKLTPLVDPVVRAVEAASRAAHKAIHLRRVDEQVNKAIIAANRSANAARVAAVKAVQSSITGEPS